MDEDDGDDSNLSDSDNRDDEYCSENSSSGAEMGSQYCYSHSSNLSECDDLLNNLPADVAAQYFQN